MSSGGFYDRDYFERGRECGKNSMSGPYTWDRLGGYFLDTASHIVRRFRPGRVCEFGCAKGFLVGAFRSRGVACVGIDWSGYAVSEGNTYDSGYLICHNLTRPLPGRFVREYAPVDMVTCFDMMEHIEDGDVGAVFENMLLLRPKHILMNICTKEIDGYDISHVNVRPREYWLEKIARYLPGYTVREGESVDVWWFNTPDTLFVLEADDEHTQD